MKSLNEETFHTQHTQENFTATCINDAHYAARDGTRYSIICGILLHEVKHHLGHGNRLTCETNYDTWLAQHCPEISRSTAYRYMTLATKVTSAVQAPLTLELANALLSPEVEIQDKALISARRKILKLIHGQTRRTLTLKLVTSPPTTTTNEKIPLEDSRAASRHRRRTCEKIIEDLRRHMLHDLCWADQENDLIEKMLKLMMEINSLLRGALRDRKNENAADIFLQPKRTHTQL